MLPNNAFDAVFSKAGEFIENPTSRLGTIAPTLSRRWPRV